MNFYKVIDRFRKDEHGVTAVEYGLIAALISVVIIGSVTVAGTELNNTFDFIASTLKSI